MPNPFPPELRWLFPRVKPQILLHLASFLSLTLASLLAIVTPLSIRWLIDSILPARTARLLSIAIGLIFVSLEGRAALSAFGNYLTFRAAQNTAVELRADLLRHIDSLSAEYFDRTPVGEMLYTFEGPIDEISYFGSDLFPSILRAVIAAGVTLSAMSILSTLLTLIVVPFVPAFLVLRQRYRRKIGEQADWVQTAKRKFSSFLEEHLSALTQIQLLRQTERQERLAFQLLTSAALCQDNLWRTGAFLSALSNLVIVTGIALTLTGGSLMVFSNKLTTGILVAFYSLLIQLFDPLTTAMEMYSRSQRTFASIRQLQAVLDTTPRVKEHPCAIALRTNYPSHVVFKNVAFRYPRQSDVMRIPDLHIFQGERTAIVGPNGAGKSTLAKLLARLYDVDSGEILIGGMNIRAITLASLRSFVCYLPAQPALFHRPVADNLRIGKRGSTSAELERVLRIVRLTKHLDRYPASLDDYIAPGASNLSNGERQRLGIARALLCRPRVLILDETTCSLDPTSEEIILQTIDRSLQDSTLIVVSHRPNTISWMRRILLMHEGRIVADGSHPVLNATNSLYRQFLASTVSAR